MSVTELTPEGEKLMNWHISELEGLLARCDDGSLGKKVIEERLIAAYEYLIKG